MSDREIEIAKWQGATENRLDQLEKRATSWDEAIGSLTKWQTKMAAYGTLVAFAIGLLVNVAMKKLGV